VPSGTNFLTDIFDGRYFIPEPMGARPLDDLGNALDGEDISEEA